MNDLDQLSELHGIQTEYVDIWGHQHALDAETKRLLLRAMRVPVEGPEEIHESLLQARQRPWQRPLPPVLVAWQGEPVWVPVVLPDPWQGGGLSWRLTTEDGACREQPLELDQLSMEEQQQIDGQQRARRKVPLQEPPEPGYHRLCLLQQGQTLAEMSLIVTPGRCFTPEALDRGRRIWGPAVQLYGVRSRRNWGIGDFTDLLRLCEACEDLGASLVGLNPLHALFPHNPLHASPYCPSSRLMHNILYLDVEAIEELQQCEDATRQLRSAEFLAELQRLRGAELVAYDQVAALKRPILEQLYAHFVNHHLVTGDERGQAFDTFQAAGGEELRLHCLYEALQDRLFATDPGAWGWPVWPEEYRDPRSAEVADFEDEHRELVEFFAYLQWQAELQLGAVSERSEELGLGIGLYQDLSVSVDRAGSEIWSNQEVFAMQASVGAPPDALGPQGQNWGLPPMIPQRLTDAAYQPLVEILRQTMRHAGALRIDHVMGLMRLFWIPPDKTPAQGAYVRYPLRDLLGIVALESQRNRCMVIGEDLGTVPDEVRQSLAPAGVLSYRLLYFERTGDDFKAPADYPAQALVAITTHDLPTLAGFWCGEDLRVRDELQLYPSEQIRQQFIHDRDRDRRQLLEALARQGLLPRGMGTDPAAHPEMTDELILAIHSYLAAAPSQVLMVQFEDLLGHRPQANLPGTTHEHPNWLRKLSVDLEDLLQDPRVQTMAHTLRPLRGTTRS